MENLEQIREEVKAIDLGTTTRTSQGQKQYLGRLLNQMDEPHKFDTSDYAMLYSYIKETYIFVTNNY